ncbi:MAG: myo-inositol-1(or 4)-monophosphatase [uncultured bacterium]|nr:MAG: myo-inositol-1(or 4)-monophosphatase [uncultured bacterium]
MRGIVIRFPLHENFAMMQPYLLPVPFNAMREPFINIAIQAARTAGNIIMRAVDRLDKIQITEKQPNDYVTEVDQHAEREIIAIIRKAHPNHSIIGEESGESVKQGDYTWIIDPLDGTRNFIHGFPHFAVSIAISYKNKIEHGVVYDPVRQELFTASRGKGAELNDRRIRVSKHKTLEESLLGTGFPHRHSPERVTAYVNSLKALLPFSGDVRRAGAATLDLAYVASGRLDGFWEMGLKPWDIAAGSLLVKEAGGLVSDFNGAEDYFKTGNIVAANPKILKLLLKHLQ